MALQLHRYVGLLLSAFLLLAGLTGSMMAFYVPLDRLLNPELFTVAPPAPGAPLLDPFALHAKLSSQLPTGQRVDGVILRIEAGEPVDYWIEGRENFVDPYTGRVVGARTWGDLSEGKKNILPFLYRLHFSLGLEAVGMWVFGIVAVLWTIDCFVGAYLTFPLALPSERRRSAQKSWLARWLPAWLIKTNKLFTLVFTWHRATGLWLWLVLLMFAWSAVALNLGEEVYQPVMRTFFGQQPEDHLPELKNPRAVPNISLAEAHALGTRLMTAEATRRGFRVLGEQTLDYLPEHGAFAYTVESTLDVSQRLAETTVVFSDDGRLLSFAAPTGQHGGSTIGSWLIALHFGAVRAGGLAYRSFVCAMGLVVALLSVSGVWIWWKRRPARRAQHARHAAKVRP